MSRIIGRDHADFIVGYLDAGAPQPGARSWRDTIKVRGVAEARSAQSEFAEVAGLLALVDDAIPIASLSAMVGSNRQLSRNQRIRFVDLNRDELIRTPLRARYTGMKDLWLPRTVLEADFLVSMPKIKTHHWSGVTLAMKNMFGIVPGARYGWPKNILHWKGIQESILDLCATVPIHFVIADGIIAMEGNGPLNGASRPLGKIVLADDPVAADSTCARLMGFDPLRIMHISEGARFLGNAESTHIDQLGDLVRPPIIPFRVVPEFENLYAI